MFIKGGITAICKIVMMSSFAIMLALGPISSNLLFSSTLDTTNGFSIDNGYNENIAFATADGEGDGDSGDGDSGNPVADDESAGKSGNPVAKSEDSTVGDLGTTTQDTTPPGINQEAPATPDPEPGVNCGINPSTPPCCQEPTNDPGCLAQPETPSAAIPSTVTPGPNNTDINQQAPTAAVTPSGGTTSSADTAAEAADAKGWPQT